MKNRNIALVVVLSIFTFGIYSLYWTYVTTNDIQKSLKNPDGSVSSGGLAVLFFIITFGVYELYWWYREGQRMTQLCNEKGIETVDNSLVYIVLALLGFSVVNTALMQLDINKIATAGPSAEHAATPTIDPFDHSGDAPEQKKEDPADLIDNV